MPTMTDTATKQTMTECRACLSEIQDDSACTNLFQAWDLPWSGMGVSIAEDLAKLANIQISISDTYSQVICLNCCSKLRNAISFIVNVQNSDMVLKRDYSRMPWPKPIQVDKTMAGNTISDVDVEIKQEVVTDDDFDMNESFNEPIEPRLDIKIEPEEITPASPSIVVEINGPISLHPETSNTNGPEYSDENLLQTVKEEPTSDDENEGNSGVPKDCMLCMKTFNTVKGLKAHVIAIHSYDTVFTPNVSRSNVCTSCNRSFATRTDLFVHETCHNKFTCYVCDEKFDTFVQLTKHRSKQCMKTTVLPRLKTLNDVRRIAQYKGMKTLDLFDLQIPVERIRELKILDVDEIKKETPENIQVVTGDDDQNAKGNGDADDILNGNLNNNVMSVVVNIRLPLNTNVKQRVRKIKQEKQEIKQENNVIPKEEPIDDCDILVPKTEPGDIKFHMKTRAGGQRQKVYNEKIQTPRPVRRNKSANVPITNQKRAFNDTEGNQKRLKIPVKNIASTHNHSLLNLPPDKDRNHSEYKIKSSAKMAKVRDNTKNTLQMEINSLKTVATKMDTQGKQKKQRRMLKNAGKEWITKKGKIVPEKKLRPLQSCRMKCAEKIPDDFRRKVFEYYWGLGSLKEKRIYTASLVDCKLRPIENKLKCKNKGQRYKTKYKNKYYLKLANVRYNTCKDCLMNTLDLEINTLKYIRKKHTKIQQMIPVYYIMDKMNAESSQTDDPRPTTPENAASEPTEHINRPNSTSVNKKTNHEQFKKEKQLQDFSENISREVNTNSSAEVSAEWIVKKDKIQIHESTKKSANNMTDSRVEINSKKVTENIQEQSKSVNDLLLSKNNAEEKYKSSYAIKETNLSQEPNKCAITDTLFSEGIKIKEEIIDQVFTPIDILVTTVETISNNETKENGSESFKSVLNKIQSVENKFNVTDEKKRRFQDSNKTRKKRVKISKSENNSKNTDKIISDVQETEESNKQARTPFDHKQDNDIFKSEDDETKDIPLQILKTDIDEETSCEQMDANEENQIEHRTPLPKSLLGKIEDNSGSESMEIQLEIHSMDKEHDNAIIEDNDFESDFVMKRSKND